MSAFKWTSRREKAALALAHGYTECESAEAAGVTDRTIRRWKSNLEFAAEVDRLSLMVGIAGRAERLRIAMRVIREKVQGEGVDTSKDLLDWLKFAQGETDGIRLDMASVVEEVLAMAAGGQGGNGTQTSGSG